MVFSVGGEVKGTLKLRLSLEGRPPIPNVYQRRHLYFFWGGGCGGGGKIILNCLALLLERPPLIRNVYQRRRFVGVGGRVKRVLNCCACH